MRLGKQDHQGLYRARSWACVVLAAVGVSLILSGGPMPSLARDTATTTPPDDATTALFSEIFDDIQNYYIDPQSLPNLTAIGLDALSGNATVFNVNESADTISFQHQGVVVATINRPTDDDSFGWGSVISAGINVAKSVTPGLSQTSEDDLDEIVIDGMLKQFDRFSRYSSPEPAQTLRDNRDGFGGIGIGIDQTDSLPRITEVFPAGPADEVGLQVDDHLVTVDGKLLQGLGRDAVVEMLRGPISSAVDVSVRRAGNAVPLNFHLIRALIVPPTVTRENVDHGIVTLRISEFNADTASSLDSALQDAKAQTPGSLRGVIIDLRGNPGGLLAKGGGVDSASLFLNQGEIVTTRGRNPGSIQNFVADNHDVTGGLPLALIVNGGSASAAEVMTAALQDNGRAIVVGSSSYGKGTVQEVNDLRNGAELTLTWARLYPPDGYLLHKHGIVPRFCTNVTGQSIDDEIERGLHPTDPLRLMPRASLDDAQWVALRQTCPPTYAESRQDLDLAKRVLRAPGIYTAALARLETAMVHRPAD